MKALVVYSTRTKNTLKIGELIADGISSSGVDVNIMNARVIKKPEEFQGYDALVFGSATEGEDIMWPMEQALNLAKEVDLKGIVGGSFGSYGWSGEASELIYNTMKNSFGMDMVSSFFRVKAGEIEGNEEAAREYGREIARKLAK